MPASLLMRIEPSRALRASIGRWNLVNCSSATVEGFQWRWQAQTDALDRMLWPVAQAAAELLISEDLGAVRGCAAEDCGWLFLDKSHRRRWCSMKSCGNRFKARQHYARHKKG